MAWALARAEENIASAESNLEAGRLRVAAENIFRAVETSLEALLYFYRVREIEYPAQRRKFTGRLVLQFLIRDTLVVPRRVEQQVSDKYLELATELHSAGYDIETVFELSILQKDFEFAEELLDKVRAIGSELFS